MLNYNCCELNVKNQLFRLLQRGIILMDCQGNTNLRQSSPTLDNLIMFLALQLSDMHILNLRGCLGASDFERMSVSRICFNDK